MRRRRATKWIGAVVSVAIGVFALAAWHGDDPATGSSGAAGQIAAFAQSPSADLPTPAERAAFLARVPTDEPGFPALDLSRLRTFHAANGQHFSVSAAPTADGGICYFDSMWGGGCFSSFSKGGGLSFTVGPAVNLDHVVVTGLVPDGATRIVFHTTHGDFAMAIAGNAFRFDLPAAVLMPNIDSYSLSLQSGRETTGSLIS